MTGTVLTNNGLALITKLVAAKATLEFSRVAVGTGKVPQDVDPQAMISLNAYKMDAQISSYGVSPDQEDVAYIVTQVSSIGVSAGFAVTEGGVFANDPDKGEILFAYLDLTEDPQYVYAETDSISKFVEITFNVLIGSVEKVTAYVTPGALVKKVEFEELEKRVAETENPTFEDYTGDISVPTASAAIEEIKSKSKLGVLLSNIKAAFKGACLIGHIVNNCVTDNPNLPLSAAQGKALMDAITVLNTNLKSRMIESTIIQNDNYNLSSLCFVRYGNIVSLSGIITPKIDNPSWTRILNYAPIPANSGDNIFNSFNEPGGDVSASIKLYVSIKGDGIYARGGKTGLGIDFTFVYICI